MFSMFDAMIALDEIDAEIARQEAEDAQVAALIDLTERFGFPAPIGTTFRRPGIPVPAMAPLAEKPHLCQRNRCTGDNTCV